MDGNKDPILDLINKHKAAMGEDNPQPSPEEKPEEDIYGNNDMEAAIAAEDKAREDERARLAAEQQAVADAAREKTNTFMPPDEKDMKYHEEAIAFQTDKLAIVTTMINKVVAKYRLISGGIPTQMMKDNTGRVILDQVAVKAELCELYEKNGEVITPEFEDMILGNWIMPDNTLAIENIENGVVVDSTIQNSAPKSSPETTESTDDVPAVDVSKTPQINITVEPNTP